MTPQQEIVRAEEAKRIIENPLFKDAVENVRQGIISAMSQSQLGDDRTHNKLVIALQLLGQIEKQLKQHIETGQLAALQLDDPLVKRIGRLLG